MVRLQHLLGCREASRAHAVRAPLLQRLHRDMVAHGAQHMSGLQGSMRPRHHNIREGTAGSRSERAIRRSGRGCCGAHQSPIRLARRRRNARRQHSREKPTARATPVWHLRLRLHYSDELTIRADRASHPRSCNSNSKSNISHPPTHLNKLTTRSLRDAPRC